VEEGEAAFYGPKIDVMFRDSLDREWQLTTIQLDFVQPERFDMTYTSDAGTKERPAVIHAALLGSFERFLGIIIEHFNGVFPFWLAPTQVAVVPVSDAQSTEASTIADKLISSGFRAEVYAGSDSLGKRIRQVGKDKIPLKIVLGDKEIESQTVTVEFLNGKKETTTTNDLIHFMNSRK
jgi:threonyl-tRNA synthetase